MRSLFDHAYYRCRLSTLVFSPCERHDITCETRVSLGIHEVNEVQTTAS